MLAGDFNPDQFSDAVVHDIESKVESVVSSYSSIQPYIVSIEEYKNNVDKIESYYAFVIEETQNICNDLRKYSADYADWLLNSGLSADKMYDEIDPIYDAIYDDAADMIYDELYDNLTDDLYDDIYDGVIDEAYEILDYDEWYDLRSDGYDMWYETRSEIYDIWYETRSDIYDFYVDVRSELWDDNINRIYELVSKFREDSSSIPETEDRINSATEEGQVQQPNIEMPETSADSSEQTDQELVDGMRPAFKQAMDDYYNFYVEYCEFMKLYSQDPSNLELLTQYGEMITQMATMDESFAEWNEADLNDVELSYYLEVNSEVAQLLLDAAS